ncbi:hypothetical protein VMCG_01575 [Cytospora schulzeri]|uniref:Uncharacterized protein n=1 Tax=Cytospora schulzeri TaxID=448051 RepID=A0A423X6K9_9PEZI|nr:hypothetical protein VMCG_01575 [Valsa malicola]
MALTIKHLNADASFLLTFEPLLSRPVPGYEPEPFHIFLDPCIAGPSKVFLPKISRPSQKEPACISSLHELPRPDLVIISQSKSDHCSESTLKQIPPTAKTTILAEPSAAKVIRSWKHFDRQNVSALERWEGPRSGGVTGRSTVIRIPVPPVVRGGEPGEVTVALIPQRHDLSGRHAAIGITYRPPPLIKQAQSPSSQWRLSHAGRTGTLPFPCRLATPPTTPRSHKSFSNLPTAFAEQGYAPPRSYAPQLAEPGSWPAPTSPVLSLRSVRSASTLTRTSTALTTGSSFSHASAQRTLSVIFSPHGTVFEGNLATYATSHLVNEAALPLTALLHCFDSVSSPWWRGGNVLLGAPAGKEIAVRLGAMCWVSCHDGEKNAKGSAAGWLKTRTRWGRHDVERVLASEDKEDGLKEESSGQQVEERLSRTTTLTSSPAASRCCSKGAGQCGNRVSKETQVVTLGSGEEVILTFEGVWNVDRRQQQQLGMGKADDADAAVPPETRIQLEGPTELKAMRRKKVAFNPLGEVISPGRRK